MHVILFQPEIPQNTGNVGRTCAFTNCPLHLIHPLGFSITDRHLKRSGMDYWHALDVRHHGNWEAFIEAPGRPQRIWMLTTHAKRSLWQADFNPGDGLLFGNEGSGCPQWLHESVDPDLRIRIPSMSENPLRSLNLSAAVAITLYEALRQTRPD